MVGLFDQEPSVYASYVPEGMGGAGLGEWAATGFGGTVHWVGGRVAITRATRALLYWTMRGRALEMCWELTRVVC